MSFLRFLFQRSKGHKVKRCLGTPWDLSTVGPVYPRLRSQFQKDVSVETFPPNLQSRLQGLLLRRLSFTDPICESIRVLELTRSSRPRNCRRERPFHVHDWHEVLTTPFPSKKNPDCPFRNMLKTCYNGYQSELSSVYPKTGPRPEKFLFTKNDYCFILD